jgi:hypothetical protein
MSNRPSLPKAGFDPDRVAYFEAAGWRAYYDRDWPKLFRLIVSLSQQQFRIPFPQSWLAAYYVARASIAWRPADHDAATVQAWYERFYRLAQKYSDLDFDPARAAELELRYNDDHRRLSGLPDKEPLLNTLTELHAEVFGLTSAQARESAAFRVLAMNRVDTITSRTSTDVEGDWKLLEADLRRCYRAIKRQTAEHEANRSQ